MKDRPTASTALTGRVLMMTATLALLAGLSGCGHSGNADEAASSDTVEMPAEEALSGIAATPAPDPSATTIPDAAPGADSMAPARPASAASGKATNAPADKD